MSENKTLTEDAKHALLHIVAKSPPWLRALVLIVVLSTGVSVAGTFIVAVISGRSVDFWPPKIGQYESPSVQQCKALLDVAKEFARGRDKEIEQFQAIMDKQVAELGTMREMLVTESANFSMGAYKAAENIEAEQKEIQNTTQRIIDVLKPPNDPFLPAQQKCAS